MKKITVALILGMIVTFMCWTQTTDGYQNLKWGATISEVTALYPNAREDRTVQFDPRNAATDFASFGVKHYIERNVGAGIDKRSFYFYQDKLFLVSVEYNVMGQNVRNANSLEVRHRLTEIFGEFTDAQPYLYRVYNGRVTIQIHSCYRNVSNDLKIEIIARLVTGLVTDTGFSVEYINPTVFNQILTTAGQANQVGL